MAAVSPTQQSLLGVLQFEVLVWELGTIDTLAASTVVVGEVTSLNHEIFDNAVEGAVLNDIVSLGTTLCTPQQNSVGLRQRCYVYGLTW